MDGKGVHSVSVIEVVKLRESVLQLISLVG